MLSGAIHIDKGEMNKGMAMIKTQLQSQMTKERRGIFPLIHYTLARISLEILKGEKPIRPTTVMKNIGFILQNVPQAEKKAMAQYPQAIEAGQEVGAIGIVGQALHDLGKIHALKKRFPLAREHFEKALTIFEEVGAYVFLKQTLRELEALPERMGQMVIAD